MKGQVFEPRSIERVHSDRARMRSRDLGVAGLHGDQTIELAQKRAPRPRCARRFGVSSELHQLAPQRTDEECRYQLFPAAKALNYRKFFTPAPSLIPISSDPEHIMGGKACAHIGAIDEIEHAKRLGVAFFFGAITRCSSL